MNGIPALCSPVCRIDNCHGPGHAHPAALLALPLAEGDELRRDAEAQLLGQRYIDPDTGCWLWTGRVSEHLPYAKVTALGRSWYVPRLAWTLWRGPIPEGLRVRHTCRVKLCFCPDHLEPVTAKVHTHLGSSPVVMVWRTGRCKGGHDWEANRVWQGGHWVCRECHNARQRRYHRARKARALAA